MEDITSTYNVSQQGKQFIICSYVIDLFKIMKNMPRDIDFTIYMTLIQTSSFAKLVKNWSVNFNGIHTFHVTCISSPCHNSEGHSWYIVLSRIHGNHVTSSLCKMKGLYWC
jgi:hypothetical protein